MLRGGVGGRTARSRPSFDKQAQEDGTAFKRLNEPVTLPLFVADTLAVLRSGNMESKEIAAESLHVLLECADHAKLVGHEGLKQLVGLAASGSHSAQAHAAGAVGLMMGANDEYAKEAIALGIISPLAKVLRSGTGQVQEQAAAAVASIASIAVNIPVVVKAGIIPSLVGLLRTQNRHAAHVHASRALANLATSTEVRAHVFKAGGVAPLLLLLDESHHSRAQEYAARALASMSHENLAVQREICAKGGVALLLALLSDINLDVQTQAARALYELCQGVNGKHRRKTQDALARAGGIAPLLSAIESPHSKQPLVEQATLALAMVARTNRANQDTIAAMGGLRALVDQLNSSRTEGGSNTAAAQAYAALAIKHICRGHVENQTAVADLGAVAQLCALIRPNTSAINHDSHERSQIEAEAAGALWILSEGHETNQTAIAGAGAIATLCQLLGSTFEGSQMHAGMALMAIAADSAPNLTTTTQTLVAALQRNPARGHEQKLAHLTPHLTPDRNPDRILTITLASTLTLTLRLWP